MVKEKLVITFEAVKDVFQKKLGKAAQYRMVKETPVIIFVAIEDGFKKIYKNRTPQDGLNELALYLWIFKANDCH